MATVDLVPCNKLRAVLERSHRIEEVREVHDKAKALADYVKSRSAEAYAEYMEVTLRARIRIGELVRELEKAKREGPPGNYKLVSGDKFKAEAIENAGLSSKTAYRYAELVPSDSPQIKRAAQEATEAYFATVREQGAIPNEQGLREWQEAAIAMVDEPKSKPERKVTPKEVPDYRFIAFIGPIREWSRQDMDVPFLVSEAPEILAEDDIHDCRLAIGLITRFVTAMEEKYAKATTVDH